MQQDPSWIYTVENSNINKLIITISTVRTTEVLWDFSSTHQYEDSSTTKGSTVLFGDIIAYTYIAVQFTILILPFMFGMHNQTKTIIAIQLMFENYFFKTNLIRILFYLVIALCRRLRRRCEDIRRHSIERRTIEDRWHFVKFYSISLPTYEEATTISGEIPRSSSWQAPFH